MPVTRGGLVLSLDFELAWGVHDTLDVHGTYRPNVMGAREAIPRLLDVFHEYDIHATWATVGLLFAGSREEALAYAPSERPRYLNDRLDPYAIEVGPDERSDPLHYGSSLINAIASCPGQEVASHSFSHYYCLEPGQTREAFAADIASAVAIAAARGIALRSFVFPRNQARLDYLGVLADNGFITYRGPEPNSLNRPRPGRAGNLLIRGARLVDAYLPVSGAKVSPWPSIPVESAESPLVNVPASHFLRPLSERGAWLGRFQRQRIRSSMRRAAESGGLFHLWWHPHNFGASMLTNLIELRGLLDDFAMLRDEFGMRSYSMGDVAREVLDT